MIETGKILFVAQNPKTSANIDKPLDGTRSGTVFGDWLEVLGLKREDVLVLNAAKKVGQRVTKRDRDGQKILQTAFGARRVVALGKYACETLTDLGIPHFSLPHPSGLNRVLNDSFYVEERLHACREFLK